MAFLLWILTMNAELTSLSDDPQELKTIIIDKSKALHFYQQRTTHLEEQVQLLRSKLYGKKSEKITTRKDVDQLPLFNEAEIDEAAEPEKVVDKVTVAPHTRKKRGRKPLPKDLPRVDVNMTSRIQKNSVNAGVRRFVSGKRQRKDSTMFRHKSGSSEISG